MKKGKAITLLSIISVLMAFVLVMTFVRFPVGIKNYNGVLGAIETDYDLSGGTAYELTLAKDNEKEVEDINEVLDTLKYRLDALGYQTYSVKAFKTTDSAVKDYGIRIETKAVTGENGEPNESLLASDMAIVTAHGELEFFGGTAENPTDEILTDGKVIAGANYKGSIAGLDSSTAYYQIDVEFTDYGFDTLKALIEENGTYYLTIKLGDNTLYNETIQLDSKTLSLTTTAGESSAKQFALQISSGGLAYEYKLSDPMTITSPYGENAELISVLIVAIVLVLAIVLFAVLYKGFGIIAGLTLILFMLIELLMFIAIPSIKINMGGIVGIVLATLLVVDGLIITMKRIEEEYANGKMVKTAVKTGFRRAIKPICSIHAVSAFVVAMLFAFADGVVKGFAITFGIGVVISALATLLFARMFTSLILPLNKYSEKFLNLKRSEN